MSTASSADRVTVSAEELQTFRQQVQAWLSAEYSLRDPEIDDERLDIIGRTPDGHRAHIDAAIVLQRSMHAAGFSGLTLPEAYGGRGLTSAHAKVLDEELARYDTPSLRMLGVGGTLATHTLLLAGTEAQKSSHLAAIASGDERWCQLFSEPDAGSDLVSLRTRAVRDGDEWVVDGQKVWSSYASDAQYGMLLARTDPDADRPHNGITMFILPMDAPGVVIQPLVDIAGGLHFNEVFLEGVRLDANAVLGSVNTGWQVANGTLGGERSGYMGGSGDQRRLRQVTNAARHAGKIGDAVVRQRMAAIISEERILEWVRDRYVQGVLVGGNPVAGSMMKLAAGTLEQRCAELVADLGGASSQAWDATDREGDVAAHALAATRQARIAGGTHQIQRNLLGERVLGLPR